MTGKLYRGWIGILVAVLLWEILALLSAKPFFPSLSAVIVTFVDLLGRGIVLHMGMSLFRVFAGLLIACLAAVPLGLLMGRAHSLDQYIASFIYLFYPVPKIAFLPFVMLIFGLGDISAVFMIFLVLFFQIVISVRDGLRELPREYFFVMTTLRSSRRQIYYHVILPGIMPKVFSTLRIGLGTAMSVLFFAETQAAGKYGIGYFIFDAMLRVQYREMFAGILAIGMLGWIVFKMVDWGETCLCPWSKN